MRPRQQMMIGRALQPCQRFIDLTLRFGIRKRRYFPREGVADDARQGGTASRKHGADIGQLREQLVCGNGAHAAHEREA